MNDKTLPSEQPDEEYHFSPEIEQRTMFAAEPHKAGLVDRLKRKNLFIALGALIVILCVYKLWGVVMGKGAPPHHVTHTDAPVQLAASAPAPLSAPKNPAAEGDNSRLSHLESQTTAFAAKLDTLASQLAEIQTSLSGLGTQLSGQREAVQALSNEFIKQQQAQLATQQDAQKKVAHNKVSKTPKPIYFVRAVIPGRAWLVTQGGGVTTVGLGDQLPGYGVVQVIDANQGNVTTSTGAIIGYSPDDS